jgi:hypothetical protein
MEYFIPVALFIGGAFLTLVSYLLKRQVDANDLRVYENNARILELEEEIEAMKEARNLRNEAVNSQFAKYEIEFTKNLNEINLKIAKLIP